MLAYVIIGIELLILYTVFWYVFLREPKPYRIKGNAWGAYDGFDPSLEKFARGLPKNGAAPVENDRKRQAANAIYQEWNAPSANVPLTAGELIRSQARGVERASSDTIKKPSSDSVQRLSSDSIKKPTGQFAVPGEPLQTGQHVQLGQQAPTYAPFNPTEQYRTNSKTLPGFLTELGDKLNRINVKLP